MARSKRRRRLRSEPTALGDLVPGVYPKQEPGELAAIRAFIWWEKAVPASVLRNARPVRLDRGVLYVNASTSVWAGELHFLKEQLLASLQQAVPKCGVRAIRIRVGKLPSMPTPPPRSPERRPVVPLAKLPDEVARALAAVGDDDIRDAVIQAASMSLAAKKD